MPFKIIQLRIRRFMAVLYIAIIVVLVTSVAILTSRSFTAGKAWVDHTTEVISTILAVQTTVLNAETGQRGYILTGDDAYLSPYKDALLVVHPQIQRLRGLVADNHVQLLRVDCLEETVSLKLAELKSVIEVRRREGMEPAVKLITGRRGKNLMDKVRMIIYKMLDDERIVMNQRLLRVDDAALTLSVSLIIVVVRDVFMFFFIIVAMLPHHDGPAAGEVIEDGHRGSP